MEHRFENKPNHIKTPLLLLKTPLLLDIFDFAATYIGYPGKNADFCENRDGWVIYIGDIGSGDEDHPGNFPRLVFLNFRRRPQWINRHPAW
jgi:hypothetical protein